jgi:signal-transduction protein with cAMP-binding, CBS, and nucleotidyltransferase domain
MKPTRAAEVIEQLGLEYLRDLSAFGALSNEVIVDLLTNGTITQYSTGEYIVRHGVATTEFQIVLSGRVAYYKHFEDFDVLTRYFSKGEQMGFDQMIGLIPYNGTDVMREDSLIIDISKSQFYDLHINHPADFGLFMINLARELSREIAILEDVIGEGTLGMS